MINRERDVVIQELPRPDLGGMGLVGVPVELTRIQGEKSGYEISTVRHPLRDQFETVIFPLDSQSEPIGPVTTETTIQARQIHKAVVKLVAQTL